MDIGEFTIYNAYLSSTLICLIAINAVGGVESTPPSGFLGLIELVLKEITYCDTTQSKFHRLDLNE